MNSPAPKTPAPPAVLSLGQLLRDPLPPQPCLVEPGLLPPQGILFVGGEPKVGKSLLVANLALALAAGRSRCGFDIPTPRRVLICQFELPTQQLALRLSRMRQPLNQLSKTGVKVVAAEATAQIIRDGKFDTAIVATGGAPRILDVPGINKRSVLGFLDVLRGVATGPRVITVGGGMIGCDIALFLSEQGKKVTLTTRGDFIGRDMDQISRQGFLERLSRQNVEIRTGVHLVEITDDGVTVCDKEGAKTQIKGDNVVLVAGLCANRGLFDDLSLVPNIEVFAVGDCVEPRRILDAIHEGFQVAFGL